MRLRERLKKAGLKLTAQRLDILAALLESGEASTARELFDLVRPRHPTLSLDTVYRTLQTLAKMGIVEKTHLHGGDLRFEFRNEQGHRHQAVCIACGTIVRIAACPVVRAPGLEKEGFQITNHILEFYGYCASCRAARQPG